MKFRPLGSCVDAIPISRQSHNVVMVPMNRMRDLMFVGNDIVPRAYASGSFISQPLAYARGTVPVSV